MASFDRKKFLAVFSAVTTVLAINLLLLQILTLALLKIYQQKLELERMNCEVLQARNAALSRYHRIQMRYVFFPSFHF